jgi:hypothetical protein
MRSSATEKNSDLPADGDEGLQSGSVSLPGPEAVTYNPPPASWFFSRGSTNNNNNNNNNTDEVLFSAKKDATSPEKSKLSPVLTNDEGEEAKRSSTNNPRKHPDWGMVSDNEDEQQLKDETMDEEEDHEGFNFIAVSNSLLMAGRSFEHVEDSVEQQNTNHSESETENNRGVLIVDGIGMGGDEETTVAVNGNYHGSTSNNNTNDASILTIPGSDSLPSDIGTISHHDEEDEDPLLEGNHHEEVDELTFGLPYFQNYPPLVHRFLRNLQQSSNRLRLVTNATDCSEVDGPVSSDVSVVDHANESMTECSIFRRKGLFVLLAGVVLCAGTTFWTSHQAAWENRLRLEEEARGRLLQENEALLAEMEALLEEAAVATVRADSLAKEQERLLLERDNAEAAYRLVLEEQEEMKLRQQEQQQHHGNEHFHKSNDGDGFSWSSDDPGEECGGHHDGGPTSFTLADNCWFKAKASIDVGSCGNKSKCYFKRSWNAFLEDWVYHYYDGGEDGDTSVSHRDQQHEDEYDHYRFQDDTYYPPQDPLKDLFSVLYSAGQSFTSAGQSFSSAGQSFYSKLTNLMGADNGELLPGMLEDNASSLQDFFSKGLVAAPGEYKEALSTLRTVALNYKNKDKASQQHVTQDELLEAAAALSSLSKAKQESASKE